MSEHGKWTLNHMPPQHGRIAIVTGANSGLGLEVTRGLASKGATVIMACRNTEKASMAVREIRMQFPKADLHVMPLDLADLSSVRAFAEAFQAQFDRLDLLINNAGVNAVPYEETPDGFELQFGTNYLGHYALTGLLMEILLGTEESRIVNISHGHIFSPGINLENLNSEKTYLPWLAYERSKLATLMFTQKLQDHLDAMNAGTICVAAHPGLASTNLGRTVLERVAQPLFGQSAEQGALSILFAATAQDVRGAEYIGPGGLLEMRGHPVRVHMPLPVLNRDVSARLWEISKIMTGVSYEGSKAAA